MAANNLIYMEKRGFRVSVGSDTEKKKYENDGWKAVKTPKETPSDSPDNAGDKKD